MKKLSSKGFTLIELLVVITIIGILATGATAVYTSAQQKARDSIRQNDVLALRSAVEQSFGDNALYPPTTTLVADVVGARYMQSLPSDPKTGQTDAETIFDYIYGAAQDATTTVSGQEYEISANFENTGNASSKEGTGVAGAGSSCIAASAANSSNTDGGQDGCRWEVGINMDNVDTSYTEADTTLGTNDYSATVQDQSAKFVNSATAD